MTSKSVIEQFHGEAMENTNDEMGHQLCLEYFIALYRAGATSQKIMNDLNDLSKEWQRRDLYCRIPTHQRHKPNVSFTPSWSKRGNTN